MPVYRWIALESLGVGPPILLEPHVERYMRIAKSENLLEALRNTENFLLVGMVDDSYELLYGKGNSATKIGAGVNLLVKAFSFGGGWEAVAQSPYFTSRDLIKWGNRYGKIKWNGTVVGSNFAIPDASNLKMSRTVLNHMNDLIKHGDFAGEVSRPYIDSNGTTLLLNEIMHSTPPKIDTYVPSGLRWDVPGTFRGTPGIWELVVDVATNTVLHFNFVVK